MKDRIGVFWKNIRRITRDEYQQYTVLIEIPSSTTSMSGGCHAGGGTQYRRECCTEYLLEGSVCVRMQVTVLLEEGHSKSLKVKTFPRINIEELWRAAPSAALNSPSFRCGSPLSTTLPLILRRISFTDIHHSLLVGLRPCFAIYSTSVRVYHPNPSLQPALTVVDYRTCTYTARLNNQTLAHTSHGWRGRLLHGNTAHPPGLNDLLKLNSLSPAITTLLVPSQAHSLPAPCVDNSVGAAVLAHSLKDNGTTKKLAVLVTFESVHPSTVDELKVRFILYCSSSPPLTYPA